MEPKSDLPGISNDHFLPLHCPGPMQRRTVNHANEEGTTTDSRQPKYATAKSAGGKRRRTTSNRVPNEIIYVVVSLFVLAAVLWIRSSERSGWWTILALLAIPVLCALFVCIRGQHANERLVSFAFVASIISNQLPRSVTTLAAALAMAIFALATRPAQGQKQKRSAATDIGAIGAEDASSSGIQLKTKAMLSCLFMIAVLLHENFQIWVVSATYTPSHEPPYPDPLQDNGRIVLRKLAALAQLSKRDVQMLRDTFNIQWALVSAAIAGALVSCELKLGRAAHRNMWAVGMRALLTLGCARLVRTISFLLTVLPSQMPSCYRSHYPYPVPDTWSEWIKVGLKPAARGGCNDLIISGHATVTSVLCCIGASVCDNTVFSLAVWSLLAFDYLVEVYQGYHYSVDMWMGAVITSLIFRSLSSVEPQGVARILNDVGQTFLPLSSTTVQDGALYVAPAVLAFVIIATSKEAIANLWIVLYVGAASTAQVKGDAHFSRHLFICTLYIALIVYL